MDPSDLTGFSGHVPIFPLPGIVLFPRMLLPLHIFEPRYREMTEHALEGDRLIAMALLRPGWEKAMHGNPPVHPILGVGRILRETRLEDGRFNLLLYGIARARILAEETGRPFRVARVEIIEDLPADATAPELEGKRKRLMSVYRALIGKVLTDAQISVDADVPGGALSDMVAAMLDITPLEKQMVLESLDVAVRVDQVLELIDILEARQRVRARGASPPSPGTN